MHFSSENESQHLSSGQSESIPRPAAGLNPFSLRAAINLPFLFSRFDNCALSASQSSEGSVFVVCSRDFVCDIATLSLAFADES